MWGTRLPKKFHTVLQDETEAQTQWWAENYHPGRHDMQAHFEAGAGSVTHRNGHFAESHKLPGSDV